MKLPDGLVRLIYKMVEEQREAEWMEQRKIWLEEHKERFYDTFDMFAYICRSYKRDYQEEYDSIIESYEDESDDEDMSVDIGNLPSFIQYVKKECTWPGKFPNDGVLTKGVVPIFHSH